MLMELFSASNVVIIFLANTFSLGTIGSMLIKFIFLKLKRLFLKKGDYIMRICVNCGLSYDEGRYCTRCGYILRSRPVSSQPATFIEWADTPASSLSQTAGPLAV